MSNVNPESYISQIIMSSFVADYKLGNKMHSSDDLLQIWIKVTI